MSEKYTPAALGARQRYDAKVYRRVTLRMTPDALEQVKAGAQVARESLNAYIMKAINQRRIADGLEVVPGKVSDAKQQD